MKQHKSAAVALRIFRIELFNQVNCKVNQRVGVARVRLRNRVRKVGKKSKVYVGVAIGEESDLQFGDQLRAPGFPSEAKWAPPPGS